MSPWKPDAVIYIFDVSNENEEGLFVPQFFLSHCTRKIIQSYS